MRMWYDVQMCGCADVRIICCAIFMNGREGFLLVYQVAAESNNFYIYPMIGA